jgi:hypothetical protein
MSRVTYPFPLEDGTQGFFYLPNRPLKAEEVERMAAFLETLVTQDVPSLDLSESEMETAADLVLGPEVE